MGTTGAIQEDIELGNVIIPVATVRDDGTTKEYVGAGYPAVASSEVAGALKKAKIESRSGEICQSYDENLMPIAEVMLGE